MRIGPLVLGTLFVGSVLTGLVVRSVMQPEAPTPVRFSVAHDEPMPLSVGSDSQDVAVSPDGKQIAYLTGGTGLGGQRLHLRSLSRLTSESLVTQGMLLNPFFSARGQDVGFLDRTSLPRTLKRVSTRGGPTATICTVPGDLRGASWGADDTIIFATNIPGSGLWRVPASGGEPQQVTAPNPAEGEIFHRSPALLPGGTHVLFTIGANRVGFESQIAVLSLDTGAYTVVLRGGTTPRYSSTGHLLYGAQGGVWTVAFDLERLETVGDPVSVQQGVLTKRQGVVDFDVSDEGVLVYVPGPAVSGLERTLVWVDRDGGEETLNLPPGAYDVPRISPDGRSIAMQLDAPANTDVMVYDLQRETLSRLTLDPGEDRSPLWSPDSLRVLFSSPRAGGLNIFSKPADGAGPAEPLTRGDGFYAPESWSADGKTLVVVGRNQGDSDLHTLSLGTQNQPEILLDTPFSTAYSEVSPDGRWIAYMSNESGEYEIYVRPFPNIEDDRWRISRATGVSPVWSADGQMLFFRPFPNSSSMMAVAVETDPTFNPGPPQLLFPAPYRVGAIGRARPWDVGSDGRFLMIKEDLAEQGGESPSEVVVVQHWLEEVNARIPTP